MYETVRQVPSPQLNHVGSTVDWIETKTKLIMRST